MQILGQPSLQFTKDDRRNNPSNPPTINRENLDARHLGVLLGVSIPPARMLAD